MNKIIKSYIIQCKKEVVEEGGGQSRFESSRLPAKFPRRAGGEQKKINIQLMIKLKSGFLIMPKAE